MPLRYVLDPWSRVRERARWRMRLLKGLKSSPFIGLHMVPISSQIMDLIFLILKEEERSSCICLNLVLISPRGWN